MPVFPALLAYGLLPEDEGYSVTRWALGTADGQGKEARAIMTKLTFKADDVRRIVEHTIKNPQSPIADWSTATEANGFKATATHPDKPHVILVHDQGIYLMSNGTPRDLLPGTESSFCAYAKGCDPKTDGEWWDNARDLVGGDDFAEYLPWAQEMLDAINAGAKTITLNFSSRGISMATKAPESSESRAARTEAEIAFYMKHSQTGIVFRPVGSKKLLTFKGHTFSEKSLGMIFRANVGRKMEAFDPAKKVWVRVTEQTALGG